MSKHEKDKGDKTTTQSGTVSRDDVPHTAVDSRSGDAHSPYSADSAALGGPAASEGDATLRDKTMGNTAPAASTTSNTDGATSSTARPEGSTMGATTHTSSKADASSHGSAGGNGAGGNGVPPKERDRGRGVMLALLVISLLVLLAALAWGAVKFMHQQRDIDALKQQVQDTSSLKSQLQNQLQRSQQKTDTLSGRIDSVDQDMDRVLKELAATQQTDAREWLYAEVEYLLRLANQRLQLERDVEGAQALLQSADQRLERADNPAFLPVRREIHSELAALDSVPDVDRSGIYLQLAAEAEQLSQLPLSQDTEALSAQVDDGSTYSGGWREQLARVGSQFKDLVTVRHHDQVLEALITPEQEGYLRQNVRLLLEQAQLALLKGEPKVYRTSLERAAELVKNYYKTDNDGVKKVLDRLDQLAGRTIQPNLPDISASLTQLREVVANRTGTSVADQQGGNGQGSSNNASSAANNQPSMPASPESNSESSSDKGDQNTGSQNSNEQRDTGQAGDTPSGENSQRAHEPSQSAQGEQNPEQAQGENAGGQEAQAL